jgi:mitogen-activated protein kinase 15
MKYVFKGANSAELDLLAKMLHFNPVKRMSIDDALEHPYVAEFHEPEREITCERKIVIAVDDNVKYTVKDYRQKIYDDITKKKKEIRRRLMQKNK